MSAPRIGRGRGRRRDEGAVEALVEAAREVAYSGDWLAPPTVDAQWIDAHYQLLCTLRTALAPFTKGETT